MPIIGNAISPFAGRKKSWRTYWTLQNELTSKLTPKLTGNDSTFGGAGSWVTALGSLNPDVTTVPGSMLLDFSSNNQAVKIVGAVESGTKGYFVRIRMKIQAGAGTTFQMGSFATDPNANYGINIVPTTTMRWYYAYLHSFASTTFYLGVTNANNNGTDFLIDEIHIDEVSLADFYDFDLSSYVRHYTDGLFSGIDRTAQTLLELNIAGDSVWSRSSTGTIPIDEGDTMRPPRLVTNNIIRQIYDKIKYNAPTYRRLDHADWAWSNALHFVESADNLMFDDVTTGEQCYYSQTANAYCEITIPDGQENFALLYKLFNTDLGQNYDDAIAVTLNGGDISAYGSATINAYNATGGNKNTHAIAQYTGLPAGENVIRFTKSNTAKTFTLWGGWYWTGNTMVVKNYSTGGSTMDSIAIKVNAMLAASRLNWIIEFPNINNSAQGLTAANQAKYFFKLLNSGLFEIAKAVFITIHPFGTDPSDGTPNYYTQYATPITLKQRSTLDICLATYVGALWIDIFRDFEQNIISRGGTLAGGEAGSYYTIDGQHLSQDGVDKSIEYMLPHIPLIPS